MRGDIKMNFEIWHEQQNKTEERQEMNKADSKRGIKRDKIFRDANPKTGTVTVV